MLLSTNTEVSIAPKLRNSASKKANPAQTSQNGTNGASSKGKEDLVPLKTPPIESDTLPKARPIALRNLPARLIDLASLDHPALNSSCTIYISPTTFSRIFSKSSSPSPLPKDEILNASAFASIRILPAPTTKGIPITGGTITGSSGGTDNAQISASSPLAVAKQLLLDGRSNKAGNGKVDGKEGGEKHERERVLFRPLVGVPEKHLVIIGQLPRSNAGEWDLVS